MKELVELIRRRATIGAKKDIVKVGFLNQKIDAKFFIRLSEEIGKLFDMRKISLIVTSEASGIPIAAFVSEMYTIPFVFAKKGISTNVNKHDLYLSMVHSHTFNKDLPLIISKKWIDMIDRVLIVDDVMANGSTANGLVDIVEQSGAKVEGIVTLMEKKFQKGGDNLRKRGYTVKSLAMITKIDNDGILHFEGDEEEGEKKYAKTKKTSKR